MLIERIPKGLHVHKTPYYLYDTKTLSDTLSELNRCSLKSNIDVHYALKANTNPGILAAIKDAGVGADCVSIGEMKEALKQGFSPDKIVLAGIGKRDDELLFALEQQIFCINCESIAELIVLNELAERSNTIAQIAIRINPGIEVDTHAYITTGSEYNKFGIGIRDLSEVVSILKLSKNLHLKGIHIHVGSQILDMETFSNLGEKLNELNTWFLNQGFDLEHVNAGGGLGIDYNEPDSFPIPDFEGYFDALNSKLNLRANQSLHVELGRALVAQCGSLVSRVLYVKPGIENTFLILDAGMNDLMRPALYNAFHKVEKISNPIQERSCDYEIVGPICESSDSFGVQRLPETKRGDLLIIRSAGAYGESMASRYNLREIPQSVWI
jgi:diaminopimelate decarboxylase